MNDMQETKIYRWLIVISFGILVFLQSWNSDDAYHAYIMAKNLAEGNGFVYNVGYRVTATTCPLFTILTALVYMILGFNHMYFAGIILGVVFSSAAVYILVFKVCKTNMTALITTTILLCCYAFMCYTTAGLENSLLYFLSALFVWLFTSKDEYSTRDLFLLALILSLLAMTRMDSVLLFVPAICIGYLFFTKVKFINRVWIGLLGLVPFIIWEVFAIIYYGYPFPNTMYIKLNTGVPKSEYISRGLDYIFRSTTIDLIIVALPVVVLLLALIRKNMRMLTLSIGSILYIIYVINVGGDFMVGRHLTVPFFNSLALFTIMVQSEEYSDRRMLKYNPALLTLIALELVGIVFVRPVAEESLYDSTWDANITGVADEMRYYYPYTGLFSYVRSRDYYIDSINLFVFTRVDYLGYMENASKGLAGDIREMLPGIVNYRIQEQNVFYCSDTYGLMDPLLSHLPAKIEDGWRVGHLKRAIPDGYRESINKGSNLITDPSLHEFYDHVLKIITGDIWSIERIIDIIKMNTGQYNYLIDEYLGSQ